MLALSATEAITPALTRTRRLLFQPFRWSTYLKLCAVAVFTEGFSGNSNFSHHGPSSPPMGHQNVPFHFNPAIVAAIVAISIVAFIVGIIILYLTVRLRFALFNCLVNQSTLIAPGWHMYRRQARRFFILSIVVAIGFLAVVAAALVPFARGFIQLYHASKLSGHVDVSQVLIMVLQLVPVILILVFLAMAINVVLRDFMLPHIALENATAGQALEAFWRRFTDEKGTFVLYAILRILLPIVAMIGMMVVLAIPMVIIFGIPGVMIAGVHSLIVNGNPGVVVVATLIEIILGLIIFALGLLVAICFGGPLSIAIRNYALVFYGGRYQPLGNLLFPPIKISQGPAYPNMDVTIEERVVSFTPEYDITAPGATYYARKTFFAVNDHLELKDGNGQVLATIQGFFSLIRDKHEFHFADGRDYQFQRRQLLKPVDTCEGNGELYTIYEHRGLKYSVFREDRQIAAFEKNKVVFGSGNEYQIQMDSDADLMVIVCIVLTLNSADDKNQDTVTIDFGNIGPQERAFDEDWQPR